MQHKRHCVNSPLCKGKHSISTPYLFAKNEEFCKQIEKPRFLSRLCAFPRETLPSHPPLETLIFGKRIAIFAFRMDAISIFQNTCWRVKTHMYFTFQLAFSPTLEIINKLGELHTPHYHRWVPLQVYSIVLQPVWITPPIRGENTQNSLTLWAGLGLGLGLGVGLRVEKSPFRPSTLLIECNTEFALKSCSWLEEVKTFSTSSPSRSTLFYANSWWQSNVASIGRKTAKDVGNVFRVWFSLKLVQRVGVGVGGVGVGLDRVG